MNVRKVVESMRQSENLSDADKAWLAEHEHEYDDLAYEESEGRKQSWNDGCMLGSPNAYKGAL